MAADGDLLIGSSAGAPTVGTLTAGTGISITNGHNSITIAVSGSAVLETLTGDSGGAISPTAGNINVIAGNSTLNSGSSVSIAGSGSTLTLNVTDANFNTIIGNGSGHLGQAGNYHCALGYQSLPAYTNGSGCVSIGAQALLQAQDSSYCVAVGYQALDDLLHGSYCIAIGADAGNQYSGTESSNISLGAFGTTGESNVIRIGQQGSGAQQQNKCYISGIAGGAITAGSPTFGAVVIDTSDGQLVSATTGISTSGFVLTSNGTATAPTWKVVPATGITTIDVDASGSVTGLTISLFAKPGDGSANAGSSVAFIAASGTEIDLQVTDSNNNTIIGSGAGSTSSTGTQNTALGSSAFSATTSASDNCAIGYQSLEALSGGTGNNIALGVDSLVRLTIGNNNISIGSLAGFNYTSSETYNIVIGNLGTTGDSNLIRIGDNNQTSCYISGIAGATVSAGSPTFGAVIIDTSDGQLLSATTGISTSGFVLTSTGTATAPTWQAIPPSGLSWTAAASTPITAAVNTGYYITDAAQVTITLPAVAAAGSLVAIAGNGAGGWVLQPGAGQTIKVINVSAGTSITSAEQYDCIEVICCVSNTTWIARNFVTTGFTYV